MTVTHAQVKLDCDLETTIMLLTSIAQNDGWLTVYREIESTYENVNFDIWLTLSLLLEATMRNISADNTVYKKTTTNVASITAWMTQGQRSAIVQSATQHCATYKQIISLLQTVLDNSYPQVGNAFAQAYTEMLRQC